MNLRCTICDSVVAELHPEESCPECGARGVFRIATLEGRRHAPRGSGRPQHAWEFSPDGPVLRRVT